ncbi:MAG TPA: hypothetical protein VL025_19590 [Thermoanaerobaculia bacterium]|nr:hypothetical protein [Thermoanaerobaculia bacterium]
MKKIAGAWLGLAACLVVFSGCFDVEQTMTLERDLSGKAGFSMHVDMEPMVLFMVRMQREMAGQTGEPTQAEIDKARTEFLASGKKETSKPPSKEEIEKQLPQGVKLLDSSFEDEGTKLGARFLFGFDNVSKLSQIKIASKKEGEDGQPGPPSQNPAESPFGSLQVKDEGSTILVTSEAMNPVADQNEQAAGMDLSPEMKKQVEDAFKGVRVAFKIDAPFEVLEHNATRQEGRTLIWEYDMKSLEKMTPEQAAQGVRVRYKK